MLFDCTNTLNQLVRQSTEVETQLVSVERVMEYSTLHQEGPYLNEAEKYYLFHLCLHY